MGAGLDKCCAEDNAAKVETLDVVTHATSVFHGEEVPNGAENAIIQEEAEPQEGVAAASPAEEETVKEAQAEAKTAEDEGLKQEAEKAATEETPEAKTIEENEKTGSPAGSVADLEAMELPSFADYAQDDTRESITPEELASFIKSCQKHVEADAIDQLVELADVNQNGRIEISELFGAVQIVGQLKGPLNRAMLEQQKQQKATVELTGHTLEAAMKMRCDTTGATYALYWVEADGNFVVAGSYVLPEHKTPLKERPGSKLSFIQQCEKMRLDRSTRLAQVAVTRQATFISDTSTSEGFTRAKVCKEFGIKSLCIIPFEDGVLEYGSLKKWDKAPDAPTMPKAQMKDAFETFGASYCLFWVKREEGFVAIAEYVTPQSKKATKNRRGNDDTFSSKSRLLTLGLTSSVAKAWDEKREVFIPDATDHSSFSRANLAAEFGMKTIRNVPCKGGVLEYGVPKDEHLEGHSLEAVLKLRCDMADAAYAIYWVEMAGQYVVGGHYTVPKVKEMLQNEKGSTHGYAEECESLKLGTNTMLASVGRTGKDVFIADCATAPKFTRTKLCQHFGIKSIHFFPITGGVFECGNIESWPVPPVCPMPPTAQLRQAFNKFQACYVMLWTENAGEWTVAAHYTTPEYIQRRKNSTNNSDTFCSKCVDLKLNENSMAAFASRSTSKQKIEDLRKPTKFTDGSDSESKRMKLAKEFGIKTVVIMPCGNSTVLEYGKAARDTNAKAQTASSSTPNEVMGG